MERDEDSSDDLEEISIEEETTVSPQILCDRQHAAEEGIRDERSTSPEEIKFRPEFLQEVEEHLKPSDVLDYLSLNDNAKERIRSREKIERKESCQLLLDEIAEEAKKDNKILDLFIYALEKEGYRRLIRKFHNCCGNRDESFKNEFLKFLFIGMKPDLFKRINPCQLVAVLLSKNLVQIQERDNINNIAIQDRVEACRELFSLLQRKNDDWEVLLYESLCATQPEIVSKINPAPDNDELQRKHIPVATPPSDHESPTGGDILQECDSDYDVDEMQKEDEGETEKEKERRIKPKYELRDYQLELAEKAISGRNTIICAETGTGKTWVALHITENHLKERQEGLRRVVFLARTNALVKQQYNMFKLYLSDYEVSHLRTETRECLHMDLMMNKTDVFFMTPQILDNNLNIGKVKMSDFTLIVFDECHHARKKEPYSILMKKYLEQKLRHEEMNLPQIVGLTATLGIGGASTEEGAMEHMIRLFANLDVIEISTVKENIEEFQQHVHQATHETLKMGDKEKDPCETKLAEAICIVEKEIEKLDVTNRREFKVFWSKKPEKKSGPTYQKWARRFKNKAACKIKDDQKLTRMVNSAMDHIVAYNEALDINYLMDIQNVLDFLFEDKFTSELHNKDKLIEFERRLINLLEGLKNDLESLKPWPENPYLKQVKQRLVDFTSQNETPRGMVFVKTRATAFALAGYLDEELSGLGYHVAPFTGTTSADNSKGMQETKKNETLQKFREGEINLLVATTVGSEGIDVPECNFIVTYNFTGNETTISQMSGRARKPGSKAVHISDASIQQKEESSLQKSIIMKNAFKRLNSKPLHEIKAKVESYQSDDLRQIRGTSEQIQGSRKEKFILICFKCHTEVARSSDVRLYTNQHRVVIADDFPERARYEDIAMNSKFTKSEIKCKQCNIKWGTTFSIDSFEVPVLKVKAVLFKIPMGSDYMKYKKWGLVPYFIEPIEKTKMLEIFRQQIKGGEE